MNLRYRVDLSEAERLELEALLSAEPNGLHIVLDLKDLTLVVRDNGVGMDPSLAAKGKAGHFGLMGMRERSARITAKLAIKSSASEGTTVELIVPGAIIYARPSRRARS